MIDGMKPAPYATGPASKHVPGRNGFEDTPSNQVNIIVTPSSRAGHFDAHLEHHNSLLVTSRSPFLDSARHLVDAGFDPDAVLIMRHDGADHDALRARLGTAAGLTVEESAHGPIFRSFRNAPQSAVAAPPSNQIESAVTDPPEGGIARATMRPAMRQ